jgi:hypothetical protein
LVAVINPLSAARVVVSFVSFVHSSWPCSITTLLFTSFSRSVSVSSVC